MDRTIDWVNVHGRLQSGQFRRVLDMPADGLVGYLLEEVGPPIGLDTFWHQRVEHALKRWERHRPNEVNGRLLEGANWSESGFGFIQRSGIAPDHTANGLGV